MTMYLYPNQTNKNGMLHIGGVSAETLANTYGTPLYVMDETSMRENMQAFKRHFTHPKLATDVLYASKAFLSVRMCKLVHEENLHLDVASGGELYTAYKAGFPMQNTYLHGNNKSPEELAMALEYGVGTIIADNALEIERLRALAKSPVKVMLRINPGIEAHTHEYIQTTKNDSKFGLSIFNDETYQLIKTIDESDNLTFYGLHSHIGSQIFESSSFIEHANAIVDVIATLTHSYGVNVPAINLGGGFGVRYTRNDDPVSASFLPDMLDAIAKGIEKKALTFPRVMIEPGRAIVAGSGVTLYRVGTQKTTHSTKSYVFVDGSMADHLRTALYGAAYEAVIANKLNHPHTNSFTVAGKACESGDVIIHNAMLAKSEPGDLMAVLSTGAYHYSMASNYNRLPRPGVVFTKQGDHYPVVRRETYEDLIRLDME